MTARATPGSTHLVLVNGGEQSVQAPRARHLFQGDAEIVFKKSGRIRSAPDMWASLRRQRRGWVYCIDLGFPAAPLAALHRRVARHTRLIFEIGDPIKPLLANQARPRSEVAVAHALDRLLPPRADGLVFRGSYLTSYFRELSPRRELPPHIWLPDGADTALFRPMRDAGDTRALRDAAGLGNRFVVGLVGNIHHNPVHDLFYGWELAEALALIPESVPVTGVVVGDGPGRPVLEAARERLGLGDRLRLVGRVPHELVARWMNVFDVALSTQTDDPVGWGRTTAKLPEYLACGTPVICTDVGEAHRWLADTGQTLAYRGMKDPAYPGRLAERILELREANLDALRRSNRELALRMFDYAVLRRNVRVFLDSIT